MKRKDESNIEILEVFNSINDYEIGQVCEILEKNNIQFKYSSVAII